MRFILEWQNPNTAAQAGTKLAAVPNTALVVEKEWAIPAAAAGEDRQEL